MNVYFPMRRLKPIARVLTSLTAKSFWGYSIQEETLAGVISVGIYYPIYMSEQALASGQASMVNIGEEGNRENAMGLSNSGRTISVYLAWVIRIG